MLGALIAVNLKNTLLQLSDPYYLWKKSKLDCVSKSLGCNIVLSFFFLPYLISFYCFPLPVRVGCVILGHILPQLALWSCYRSGIFHPGGDIQDAVVSQLHSKLRQSSAQCKLCINVLLISNNAFSVAVTVQKWFRLWPQTSTKTRRCTIRYENKMFVCISGVTHNVRDIASHLFCCCNNSTGHVNNRCENSKLLLATLFRKR